MNFPRAADIGFTCLTIVLVGLAATSYLKPVAGESRQEVFPAGSELPMAYPQPTGVGQVLLAFKSDCGLCLKSVPFYTKLAAYCQRVGVDFRVLALESPHVVRAVFGPEETRELDVVQVSDFDFLGTPAIVVTNAESRVVSSWLGWLSPGLEQKVIDAIEELAR
jgi:hypothetical protein